MTLKVDDLSRIEEVLVCSSTINGAEAIEIAEECLHENMSWPEEMRFVRAQSTRVAARDGVKVLKNSEQTIDVIHRSSMNDIEVPGCRGDSLAISRY